MTEVINHPVRIQRAKVIPGLAIAKRAKAPVIIVKGMVSDQVVLSAMGDQGADAREACGRMGAIDVR